MEFYRAAHFQETAVGRFPKDWNIKKIGDISRIVTGGTPSTKHPEYFDGNIKWLKSGDIKGLYIYDTEEKITELGIENSNAKIHPPNSVAIALSGRGQTRGRTAITKTPMSCSQSVAFMIPNEEIVPEYLHYNLSNRYIEIRNLTGDLDRSGLNLSIVSKISVPFPSLDEQHGIVEVLSCVDLAIQKTDEVIAKTEHLKKGLMQKLLTEGIGHKEFKDTVIGKIPKEWTCEKVGNVARISRGAGYQYIKKLPPDQNGINLIRINDFVSYNPIKVAATPDIMRYCIQKNDILFAGTGASAGITMLIDEKMKGYAHSYNALVIRPQKIMAEFLYFCLNSSSVRKQETFRFTGAAQHFLDIRAISNLLIPYPPDLEQRKIVSILSDVDRKLELDRKEKSKLEKIKLCLMELLLSGKVRVKVD